MDMVTMGSLLGAALREQHPFPRGDGIHYLGAVRAIRSRTGVSVSRDTLYRAVNGVRVPDEPTLYVIATAFGLPFERLRSASPGPAPENSDQPP